MKKIRVAVAIVLMLSLVTAFFGTAVAEEILLLTTGQKAVLQPNRLLILSEKNEWKVAPVGKYLTTEGKVIKVGSEGITIYYQK
jgi:lipase chaperone LimK